MERSGCGRGEQAIDGGRGNGGQGSVHLHARHDARARADEDHGQCRCFVERRGCGHGRQFSAWLVRDAGFDERQHEGSVCRVAGGLRGEIQHRRVQDDENGFPPGTGGQLRDAGRWGSTRAGIAQQGFLHFGFRADAEAGQDDFGDGGHTVSDQRRRQEALRQHDVQGLQGQDHRADQQHAAGGQRLRGGVADGGAVGARGASGIDERGVRQRGGDGGIRAVWNVFDVRRRVEEAECVGTLRRLRQLARILRGCLAEDGDGCVFRHGSELRAGARQQLGGARVLLQLADR